MNKPLFLFVGRSASGKTTVANMLEKDGYKQIASYTTRPPRYENEKEHTFISEDEYSKLENIVASTTYNGYHYCTTLEQIQNADIYVVDIQGVQTLLNNYKLLNRQVYVIFFEANTYSRIQRMIERGDSDTAIVGRLLADEKENWYEQLYKIHDKCEHKFYITAINANLELEAVYNGVKDFFERMEDYEEYRDYFCN